MFNNRSVSEFRGKGPACPFRLPSCFSLASRPIASGAGFSPTVQMACLMGMECAGLSQQPVGTEVTQLINLDWPIAPEITDNYCVGMCEFLVRWIGTENAEATPLCQLVSAPWCITWNMPVRSTRSCSKYRNKRRSFAEVSRYPSPV